MQKTHSYGPDETLEPDPKANVQHVKNRLRKHHIALGDLPIAAIGRYTVITTYDTNGVQPDPKEMSLPLGPLPSAADPFSLRLTKGTRTPGASRLRPRALHVRPTYDGGPPSIQLAANARWNDHR